jgi:glycerol dehydrogenase
MNKQSDRNFTAAFPGKYIQGLRALAELPRLVSILGKNGFILASPSAKSKVLPGYDMKYPGVQISVEEFQGECSEKELKRLGKIISNSKADVIVGIGGGKTIDAAKIAADRADLPVIIVPTIASNDAPCSGCAVIYTEQGVFESVYYQKMNPHVVLVDTSVIAAAPVRFLVAGMGDGLSTWFEARSCEGSGSENVCGGSSTMTGLNLARLCYDTLLQYGPAAKRDCENKIVTPALDHIIEANILLSGIGFESSGLATAHAVHNGLSVLEETRAFFHGEKVAFGVLTGLHITGAAVGEMNTVYSFCEEVGLPTTFSDIGVKQITGKRLNEVAVKACAPGESIHHEAFDITPETVVNAMIAADVMGRARKNI